MTSVNDVRETFIDFFRGYDHEVVTSSPLVPHNDPTLLFTNAGMVQFKNVFTGVEKRNHLRATTAQKCVRAGGKHNDLDSVGYTARHHTFFEMLGNFSFGDYFKEQAIAMAWELTTDVYGLSPDKLLITVHSSDEDSASIWRKVTGFPDSRIIRIPTSDNFWSMGDIGPCGPCSEIFIDQGEDLAGGPPGHADQDGDRFLEFWNLVFMQYEQKTPDHRVDLPAPSVDTGMGLERMSAVLQGVKSNYDTDLFNTLINAASDITGRSRDGNDRVSFNVIADHLRASAFLIADGVMPSNEGRGYVLRRIMRRAMRHVFLLGHPEPLMHRLVPVLENEMGRAFPELVRARALISATLELEESRFRETLERGNRLLANEVQGLAPDAPLPGEIAFRLYDTYGFPLDLTEDALRREGRGVDRAGFENAMAIQRQNARRSWDGTGDESIGELWFDLYDRHGATEFLGYGATQATGKVLALIENGEETGSSAEGSEVALLANQTPFYAESGGQVGDQGEIQAPSALLEVFDTRKQGDALHVHYCRVRSGTVEQGDVVELVVNSERRDSLRANHSATHLLHESLRRHLGDHVTQKGSLVAPDRLRFDFSHPIGIQASELASIEADVNANIRRNGSVVTRLMAPQDAIDVGALALFGEKYGDEVRVVSMGTDADGFFSTELCGGTHVERTGDIGLFSIVSESAIASGVRRIEALTADSAFQYLRKQEQTVRSLASRLRTSPGALEDRVSALVKEKRELEQDVASLQRKLAAGGDSSTSSRRDIAGVQVVTRVLDDVPGRELRGIADQILRETQSGIAVVAATHEGKAAIVASVDRHYTDSLSAVDLVRTGVIVLGGKGGGGRVDMAQGGGPEAEKTREAVAAIENRIESLLSAN